MHHIFAFREKKENINTCSAFVKINVHAQSYWRNAEFIPNFEHNSAPLKACAIPSASAKLHPFISKHKGWAVIKAKHHQSHPIPTPNFISLTETARCKDTTSFRSVNLEVAIYACLWISMPLHSIISVILQQVTTCYFNRHWAWKGQKSYHAFGSTLYSVSCNFSQIF